MKSETMESRERQEALYRFLLSRGDRWTSMEQATDSVRLYPAFFTGVYHDSTTRRMLTKDIQAINESGEYEKIIVSGNQGIKLANENDFNSFVRSEMREIFKKLARVRGLIRKGSHDQQVTLEGEIVSSFLGK